MIYIIHNNIKLEFENINYWISDGISNDAMVICALQWRNVDIHTRNVSFGIIRNFKTYIPITNINKLTKW